MYSKNLKQKQDKLLPSTHSSKYFYSKPNIQSSIITQTHFAQLSNYKNYLIQSMQCLSNQHFRDTQQVNLIYTQIRQQSNILAQQINKFKNQIKLKKLSITSHQNNITNYSDKNFDNQNTISSMNNYQERLIQEGEYQQQQSRKLKLQINYLTNQQKTGKIDLIANQNNLKDEQCRTMSQKMQQQSEKISQLKQAQSTKQQNLLQHNWQQNTLIEQLNKKNCHLHHLSQKISNKTLQYQSLLSKSLQIKQTLQQIQQMKSIAINKLQRSLQIQNIIIKQSDNLHHQIKIIQKNIQFQSKELSYCQQQNHKQIQLNSINANNLQGLSLYIQQLKQTNLNFQNLLLCSKKKDVIGAQTLLQKLSINRNYPKKKYISITNIKNQDQSKLSTQLINKSQNNSYKHKIIQVPSKQSPDFKTRINQLNDEPNYSTYSKSSRFNQPITKKPKQNPFKQQKSFHYRQLIQQPRTPKLQNLITFQPTLLSRTQDQNQCINRKITDIMNRYKQKLTQTHPPQSPLSTVNGFKTYILGTKIQQSKTRSIILKQLTNFKPNTSKWGNSDSNCKKL